MDRPAGAAASRAPVFRRVVGLIVLGGWMRGGGRGEMEAVAGGRGTQRELWDRSGWRTSAMDALERHTMRDESAERSTSCTGRGLIGAAKPQLTSRASKDSAASLAPLRSMLGGNDALCSSSLYLQQVHGARLEKGARGCSRSRVLAWGRCSGPGRRRTPSGRERIRIPRPRRGRRRPRRRARWAAGRRDRV